MAVDFDTFLDWARDRFGEENVKVISTSHGIEICTHSFFAAEKGIEDYKYHLWMNPGGGKKQREEGVYRCWYTDAMGSLVSLVSRVDRIPYEEAEDLICDISSLRLLEQKVAELLGQRNTEEEIEKIVNESSTKERLQLPDFTFEILSLSASNHNRIRAEKYLKNRKLPANGLCVCIEGKHKNRIIIPYYNRSGKLAFYNARAMTNNKKVLRYMKCEEVEQGDVLFLKVWPSNGSKIYITEGEFDALTLNLAGFYGCACGGKFLSDMQAELIRGYKPVLAFDSDEAGEEALANIGQALLSKGITPVCYVRPPKFFKDWNKFLEKKDGDVVRAYIRAAEKDFTQDTLSRLILNRL